MGRYCVKNALQTLEKLTTIEVKILEGIYYHRCLTRPQIEFLIKGYPKETTSRSSLNTLLELKLIEVAYRDLHNRETYCLTSAGIQIVRQTLNLGENILTTDTRQVIRCNYYTAGKLRPTRNRFERQNQVNRLSFEIQNLFEKNAYYRNKPYHFYDYLFCPPHLKSTQCQALLQTFGFNFFIHYEDFDYTPKTVKNLFRNGYIKPYEEAKEAGTPHLFEELNPVVVLITKTKETADFYRQLLYRIFNDHFITFQVIIGTEAEIYKYLFEEFLPEAAHHKKNSILKAFETQFHLNLKYRFLHQENLHTTYGGLFVLNHQAYLINSFHPVNLNSLYRYFHHYEQIPHLKYRIQTLLMVTKHVEELHYQLKLFEAFEIAAYRPHVKVLELNSTKTLTDLQKVLNS